MADKTHEKSVALNRRASHDYYLEEKFECGIVLTGTEIKSVREGKVQFQDSYISIYKGEAWIKGMHISPYSKSCPRAAFAQIVVWFTWW